MSATLNQLIGAFAVIAKHHANIHSFHAANDISDVVNTVENYPILFVKLNNVTPLEKNLQYSFTAYILTKPEQDNSDIINVYSDTIQTMNDVLSLLENSFDFDLSFSLISPVYNILADIVSGCQTDITITVGRKKCAPLKCD